MTLADVEFAHVAWRGRPQRIEFQWVGDAASTAPAVVFLHEGLGSVSMWRDFPARFCEAHGLRGLVFSRPGYGRSTPRAADEHWQSDFMHRQAHEVLPALLAELGIERPWLFGHSDGGSIALLHATRHACAGLVVMAPHILVEEFGLKSIRAAREAYLATDLRQRLARHHDDPDSAFWGWNDIWLAPAFVPWSIEAELGAITCPVLAIQGEDDEYGTLAQIEGIARRVAQTRLLVLPRCGHAPHRDQAEAVMREAGQFINAHSPSAFRGQPA